MMANPVNALQMDRGTANDWTQGEAQLAQPAKAKKSVEVEQRQATEDNQRPKTTATELNEKKPIN